MSEFFPTKDGADAVLRGARRRRTAKASATGSSALLVAVALVLTTAGGSGPVRHSDELVTSSPSATASTTGSASPAPTSRPQSAPSTAARSVGGPGPSLFPSQAAPAQTPPPAQHRTAAARKAPITRSDGTIASTDLCTDGQADQALTWCIRVLDPADIKRGHAVSLGAEFCLYPTSSPMTLDFASTAQIDLQIENGTSHPDWYAGEGYRYSKPGPSVTVAPGQCLVWHSPWDTRDAEGFVEPPGTYTLDFMVRTKGDPPIGGSFRTITVVD